MMELLMRPSCHHSYVQHSKKRLVSGFTQFLPIFCATRRLLLALVLGRLPSATRLLALDAVWKLCVRLALYG